MGGGAVGWRADGHQLSIAMCTSHVMYREGGRGGRGEAFLDWKVCRAGSKKSASTERFGWCGTPYLAPTVQRVCLAAGWDARKLSFVRFDARDTRQATSAVSVLMRHTTAGGEERRGRRRGGEDRGGGGRDNKHVLNSLFAHNMRFLWSKSFE